MATAKREPWFTGLSRNTVLLALASLFSDISTEMLFPILPIYLTQTLKAGGSVVGLIEGIATGLQNLIQGFSGSLSDRLQRRKPLALAGFAISALSKPLIGLAGAWPGVLGARTADRLGAGFRSAPRDALVAASDGNVYGTSGRGGSLNLYRVTPTGVISQFATMDSTHGFGVMSLLQGQDAANSLRLGSAVGASCVRAIGTTTSVFTRAECEAFVRERPLAIERV